MFCSVCGHENAEGSKFCAKCGYSFAGIKDAGTPGGSKENKSSKGIYALLLTLISVVIIIIIFLILFIVNAGKERTPAWWEDSEREKTAAGKADGSETDEAEGEAGEDDETEKDSLQGNFLVAVPADYMSLRTSPGLGDDVIEELEAGQYMAWNGEAVTVEDNVFYKVTVETSGNTGYVAADFCVPVSFRDDPAALTIVDVTDALYTYEEMQEDIWTLCSTYPECLSYETIGSSVDGRDIYSITLGEPEAPHHIFVQAAIHGREYMTAQLVMRMLEYYAANYEEGSYYERPYRELFENTAVHIIPMSNPDGVTISQLGTDAMANQEIAPLVYECYLRDCEKLVWEEDLLGDMNWADYFRQEDFDRTAVENPQIISYEEYQTLWKSNANGVDLNNNFDAGWAEIDLKQQPSYGNYKGPYAVSEPETYALVSEAVRREYDYFISYHAKGQLIYYDVNGNEEDTSQRSYALASDLQSLLKYKPVNTQKGYNVNLGGFGDWVQLGLQGTSVTIESGKHPCPLAIEEFDAIWNRHRESWAMLCYRLSM